MGGFRHCKANGNGHPNQQPAGCSTGSLTFAYSYDSRGLIAQRDVTTGSVSGNASASDAVTTETTYAHDALGRLTRSVTGVAATIYAWDASSNLVGEGGTDDPTTAKVGDAYAVARTVDAANELATLVKNPVGTPGGKVATTTRAASMNRHAYVEGAPESFVDQLGFYRAAAALQAQKLAALNAAFQSALDELNRVVASQSHLQGWSVAEMMAS
jgi:YD repeat-containing protein